MTEEFAAKLTVIVSAGFASFCALRKYEQRIFERPASRSIACTHALAAADEPPTRVRNLKRFTQTFTAIRLCDKLIAPLSERSSDVCIHNEEHSQFARSQRDENQHHEKSGSEH